jgi:hypothetical protein
MVMEHQNRFTVIASPLDQFEVRDLLCLNAPIFGNINISITNIGLYLTIGALLVIILNIIAINYNKVVSNC